jgi:phosphoglycolate phosphatase-like HAD superfamily hydrolase
LARPLRGIRLSSTVVAMQFLIELDGPVLDVRRRYEQAHRRVQQELGLASREPNEFWRLIRKGAELPEIVRPTRAGQLETYARRFEALLRCDELSELDAPKPDVATHLARLSAVAPCVLIAMRAERHAAQRLLDRYELWRWFREMKLLSQDRSVRLAQLSELVSQTDQTVAAVVSETLVKAVREAGAIVAGVTGGICTPKRLRQAGADLIVSDLRALDEIIRVPTDELIRAGYRPVPASLDTANVRPDRRTR